MSEFFEVGPQTTSAISAGDPPEALHAAARAEGFIPMRQHADALCAAGRLDQRELFKVFGLGGANRD